MGTPQGPNFLTIVDDLAAAWIVPMAYDSTTGIYTEIGQYSIKGLFESVDLALTQGSELAMASDRGIENYVPLYEGFRLSMTEKWQRGNSTQSGNYSGSRLLAAAAAARFVKAQITLGVGGGSVTFVLYGMWTETAPSMRGQGTQTVTMTIVPVDPGYNGSNPSSPSNANLFLGSVPSP